MLKILEASTRSSLSDIAKNLHELARNSSCNCGATRANQRICDVDKARHEGRGSGGGLLTGSFSRTGSRAVGQGEADEGKLVSDPSGGAGGEGDVGARVAGLAGLCSDLQRRNAALEVV